MKLTILGTSCSIPTKDRNTSGYFLEYKNHGILFDCGEGIQRQFKKAGLKLSKITTICLTHWHGDHSLGLAGIIQTLGGLAERKTLHIYGPKGSKQYFEHLCKSLAFDLRLDVIIHEIKSGIVLESEDYYIDALPMKHRVTCYAYRFVERDVRRISMKKVTTLGLQPGPWLQKIQQGKDVTIDGKKVKADSISSMQPGRVFTYITDTLPNPNTTKIAKDADVLLCECVYEKDLATKAKKHGHLTTEQVANIAKSAKVCKLILTHFSARYNDTTPLTTEVAEHFDGEIVAGEDFLTIDF